MELKRTFSRQWEHDLISINRTFMELKRNYNACYNKGHNSINRTFMELKQQTPEKIGECRGVLIEPLWN